MGIPLTNGSVISLVVDPITGSLAKIKTKQKNSTTSSSTNSAQNGHMINRSTVAEEEQQVEEEGGEGHDDDDKTHQIKGRHFRKTKKNKGRRVQRVYNFAVFFSSEPTLQQSSSEHQGKDSSSTTQRRTTLDHPIVGGRNSAAHGGSGGGEGDVQLYLLKGGPQGAYDHGTGGKLGNNALREGYSVEYNLMPLTYSRAPKMYVVGTIIY